MNILRKIWESSLVKEDRKEKTIVIKCFDEDDELSSLIDYIKGIGNIGHSFEIIVDPDTSDYRKKFDWDGDGGDRINDIQVS